MAEVLAIMTITSTWAVLVGLIGLVAARLLRQRSLLVSVLLVVGVTTGVFVAGLVGTARAMFLSDHDFRVTMWVTVTAGVVACVFGLVVARMLARSSESVRDLAAHFEVGTVSDQPESVMEDGQQLTGPAEITAIAVELDRTRERLIEARRKQHQLEDSRRKLVAWVSHDLRTPLAGLRAMAEALEDGMVGDPSRYHRRMITEVERMGRMVDDLFELSRIHAGVIELDRQTVSLNDLVSDAIAGVDPMARASGVTLRGAAAQVSVRVDPTRMSRVLANLLTNGVRHTSAEGVVGIDARESAEGIEISVSDACGGIAESDLDRVFDVAWRGESARTHDSSGGGGAGLGLAVVKGIVEAHGGTVAVDNVGPGCRFVIELPSQPTAPAIGAG